MVSLLVRAIGIALIAVVCVVGASTSVRGFGDISIVDMTGETPYDPTWESLDKRPCPSWYDEAKFGIFIHWGVYSVPAWAPVGTYAEWYWANLLTPATRAHHNAVYGEHFEYQDFAPMFKAENFNATYWADLLKKSGAKYVVPTSKHHEGFTLWPSKYAWNWNAKDIGPKRDLLGELLDAVEAAGLHRGAYYSLYEWYNPMYRGDDPHQYVEAKMLPELHDLISTYKPEVLFTDGEWEHPSDFWESTKFLAWLFNESPVKDTIVVNDRWGSDTREKHGGYYTPEYSSKTYLNHKWEENSGLDVHSFGWNRNTPADKYLTRSDVLKLLTRTVAYGGNLLLDIGPDSHGNIPSIMEERLLQIGEWLDVNGDAIYSTRPWKVQEEKTKNSDITVYYTAKGTTVYALINQWPGKSVQLTGVAGISDTTSVHMLGVADKLSFTTDNDSITVAIPQLTIDEIPCQDAYVLSFTDMKQ
eukprot:GFYU01001487.1.p1 GENE.GFYU01001487.1~~GFYU01001487.1.p1  ORF type:complete len:497 (-),score=143.01 GFYU01001487.1:99-1511(-)